MNNPWMMNGGIPKGPTTKELWKNEKSEYRIKMIILAIGISALFVLTLTSFILGTVNKVNVIDALTNKYMESQTTKNHDAAYSSASSFFTSWIVMVILKFLALFAGTALFATSLYKSYKAHNFGLLSPWPTTIIGVGAFLAFIQVIWGSSRQLSFTSLSLTFSFAADIVFIVIYVIASAQVSKIRRVFLFADRMEKLQSDPAFKNMQQQMMGQNSGGPTPFSPMGGQTFGGTNPSGNANQNQQNPVQPEEPKVSPEEKRLQNLSIAKLKQVAKELSISGYTTMTKDELIEAILRVTNSKS